MKLLKCYVSAFGKLKDFTYDFSSGLNTVKEENGWGKSTFATFIKAMFYGLSDSKRSVSENERIKYKPWNSTNKFGGYVCFEWGGKEFRLERFFGVKEAEDTVRLFDNATGREYPNTQDLGRRIFEIDEEGFLSTTYFSQKDFQVKSNTSITAKFNAVCEIQDSAAFDKALSKVEEKAKTYKYRGERGLIPDAKREIRSVEDDIIRAENSVSVIGKLRAEEKELEREISVLEKKNKNVNDRISVAGKAEALLVKKEQFEKLSNERKELLETAQSAKEILNGNRVEREKIYDLDQKSRDLIGVDAQIDAVKKSITDFADTAVTEKSGKISALDVALYVTTFLLHICFVFSRIFSGYSTLTIILAVLCALFILVTAGDVIYRVKTVKPKNDRVVEIVRQKEQELNLLEEKKYRIENEIDVYISAFALNACGDRTTALSQILRVHEVAEEVEAKIKVVESELNSLAQQLKGESVASGYEDINNLNRELSEIQSEYKKKVRDLEFKRYSIRSHEESANDLPELESKKAELLELIKYYEDRQNVLNHTARFLKQADENLKTRYKAPLQNAMKKYFDYVSGSDKPVDIDVDLKVTVEEGGERKDTEYYSKGYRNLFEICKRFALVDVLFTGEKPFIILDDPFYNLDDVKLASAIELIKKLAEDYQILYLVCHESRRA